LRRSEPVREEARSRVDEEAAVRRAIAQAVAAEDYEAPARLRDQLNALRGRSRFIRPEPGKRMGLWTDVGPRTPPEGGSRRSGRTR